MVLDKKQLMYTGKIQPGQGERDSKGQLLAPYYPDEELVEAVNLAIDLERPLLIKGEPGCGKTRLAQAVAYELKLPCEHWPIKSTSRARDGLYTYDTVSRLRDAHLAALGKSEAEEIRRLNSPEEYIHWGPLGRAFRNMEERAVVLIDEIDKADIDFPNDLLQELDEKAFTIYEAGLEEIKVQAEYPPIIFITSNDERDLPDAFLRRCLFHYIKFPEPKRLEQILQAHFPQPSKKVIQAVVNRFMQLRKQMVRDKGIAGKKVSTSELIDWFKVLKMRHPEDEILLALKGELPYASILLKSFEDHQRYLKEGI